MEEKSYSLDYQDLFVLLLLNNQKNGKFVDIGSCHPMGASNTCLLEKFNWSGVCIDKDNSYGEEYKERNCLFLNTDALNIDYRKLFKYMNFNNCIDYLSLDIDDNTTDLLGKIPFDLVKFKIITIEHDAYRNGDAYRTVQREFLSKNGYKLIYGNVFVESAIEIYGKERPYEDWWVHPDYININLIDTRENIYPSEIIKLLTIKLLKSI
jgi:hypothetical protein